MKINVPFDIGVSATELAEKVEDQAKCEIEFRLISEREKAMLPLSSGFAMATINPSDFSGSVVLPGPAPERAVVHEILHLKRWLADGVWQLAPKNEVKPPLNEFLFDLENGLEHLSIVPSEFEIVGNNGYWDELYLDTLTRWKPSGFIKFDLLRHALFTRQIIPDSEARKLCDQLLSEHSLMASAGGFIADIEACKDNKMAMIKASIRHLGIANKIVQAQRIKHKKPEFKDL